MAIDAAGRALSGVVVARLRRAAARPVLRRCAHRHVDVDQRHDVVDAGGRRQRGRAGHQIMPALTFAQGKLQLVYYDLREDVSQLFGQYVDELPILSGTHLPRIGTRSTCGRPGRSGAESGLRRISPLAVPLGRRARLADVQQLEFNPPNLPIFRAGTSPFMGDYLDIATEAPFVRNGSTWSFNTAATGARSFTASGPTTATSARRPTGDWTRLHAAESSVRPSRPRADSIRPSRFRPASLARPGCATRTSTPRASRRDWSSARSATHGRCGTIQRSFPVFAQNNGDRDHGAIA